MKLFIDNFAKIRKANIDIDGITVIAGENNTGKSTIGKILFSLFNSTAYIEDKIQDQRYSEIRRLCISLIRNYTVHNGITSLNYIAFAKKIWEPVLKLLDNNTYTTEESRYVIHAVLALSGKIFENESDWKEIEDTLVKLTDFTERTVFDFVLG